MEELAEELALRGHQVTVSTSFPKVNLPYEFNERSFEICSKQNNVNVIRTKTPVHPHEKSKFAVRGISYLILPYLFFLDIRKYIKNRIEAVIVYSPPLTLAMAGRLVKRKYGAKFLLNVQDIFPQNAIDLGVMRNSYLIRFFEGVERKAYADADIVTVHSANNRQLLTRERHCPSDKVAVLHNWMDLNAGKRQKASDGFRRRYGLGSRFAFFFGGVMGPSQGLDVIIEVAGELKSMKDIVFLLVGDGLEKGRLEKRVEDLKLDNVVFGPFVEPEEYRALLREVDVGLVCLSTRNKTPVVPGKIVGYMAASVPILALLNKESDGHHIIQEARCGYSELSNDPLRAASLMVKMYRERKRLKQYGENGFRYAAEHFSKKACVDKLEELLR